MGTYHHFGNPRTDYHALREYIRDQQYFQTNYDRNSPYEQMKRNRHHINIMVTGFENWDQDPEPKSCKFCHEVLIPTEDGANWLCQACGLRSPTSTTSTSTSDQGSIDKGNPTLPKESKSKLKQKDSLENKSFVVSVSQNMQLDKDAKRRSRLEGDFEDSSALNYFSGLYGNVGDY